MLISFNAFYAFCKGLFKTFKSYVIEIPILIDRKLIFTISKNILKYHSRKLWDLGNFYSGEPSIPKWQSKTSNWHYIFDPLNQWYSLYLEKVYSKSTLFQIHLLTHNVNLTFCFANWAWKAPLTLTLGS